MACVVGFGFSSSGFLGDSLVAMGLIGCYVVVVQALFACLDGCFMVSCGVPVSGVLFGCYCL